MDEFGGETLDVADVSDEVDDALADTSDVNIDLDAMSLDELYALRDELTDAGDTAQSAPNDYSFHWDGTPTHNVEWDDEPDNTTYTRVLRR